MYWRNVTIPSRESDLVDGSKEPMVTNVGYVEQGTLVVFVEERVVVGYWLLRRHRVGRAFEAWRSNHDRCHP